MTFPRSLSALGLCCLISAAPNAALAGDVATVAVAPDAQPPPQWNLPENATTAGDAWRFALTHPPKLVSLAHEAPDDASQSEKLRARLQVLGDKTFSNREWHHYWERQSTLAAALAEALASMDAAVAAPDRGGWGEDLRVWAALATDKMANQDRYLVAIETERDAIGDHIEALLDAGEPRKPEAATAADRGNPYIMLQHQLTELERRIEIQRHKRIDVAAERALQSSQLTSAKGIVFAIEKDVELAHREGALSTAAAKRVGPWQAYWKDIATRSVNKIDRLENEAIAEQARSRGRSVEIDLLASQESFRDARIGDLTAEHAALSGVRPRLIATRDTLVNWVTTSAWRIILGVLLVWIAMGLILRLVHRALKLWALRAEGVPGDTADDDTRTLTIVAVLSGVARPAVYVVGALVALEIIGINTGPLLGSVAILGLAISFGSQNLVRDIVNGFFILMEHQFAVGEIIEIGGKTGTVERITIRSTWIRQANGDLHVVPNGTIEMVSNLTRDWSRAIVHVGVAYGADIAKVREVCNAVGEALFADPEWTGRVEEAPAWVGVTELGDSAVVVRVMGRVRAGEQWAVQRELNERLKLAFDVAKIEIPYPHRVVVQRPV